MACINICNSQIDFIFLFYVLANIPGGDGVGGGLAGDGRSWN